MERLVYRIGGLLNALAASFMALFAIVILVDVVGRGAFNSPLVGVHEIIANSVVAVTFLQIPFAISAGSMIHTPVILNLLSAGTRNALEVLILLTGAGVFALLAYASIGPMISAYETGQYFGEGALRVPTVYTRVVIVLMSGFAAVAYLVLAIAKLTGRKDVPIGGEAG